MDHSHMDHGASPMERHRCNMAMLFTWNTKDLCIVFYEWHVTGTLSLIFSLLAIVALGVGYELVRELSRRYEAAANARIESIPLGETTESSSLLAPGRSRTQVEKSTKLVKALFYAVQVFYSFFIMLLFMTYNGWIMLAVAVGAFAGYLLFSPGPATKTVACH